MTVLDELEGVLERELSQHFARPVRISALDRRPFAYSTSFAQEEIRVRLSEGLDLHLIFKDLSWRALDAAAARIKPAFLRCPEREIKVYRELLPPVDATAAVCYGSESDPDRERYWLFLEYIPGYTLFEVETSLWPGAAVWLARMHRYYEKNPRLIADRDYLIRYDAEYFRRWAPRALEYVRWETAGAGSRDAFHHVVDVYEQVVERLDRLPRTFVHGEFFASNVLVLGSGAESRIYPIDWEMAGVGSGLLDVAALTAGNWSSDERDGLGRAYWEALEEGERPAWTDFLEDFRYCRLHVAMQWLGWAPGWTPPPEHTHNWLGEALSAADELDL